VSTLIDKKTFIPSFIKLSNAVFSMIYHKHIIDEFFQVRTDDDGYSSKLFLMKYEK